MTVSELLIAFLVGAVASTIILALYLQPNRSPLRPETGDAQTGSSASSAQDNAAKELSKLRKSMEAQFLAITDQLRKPILAPPVIMNQPPLMPPNQPGMSAPNLPMPAPANQQGVPVSNPSMPAIQQGMGTPAFNSPMPSNQQGSPAPMRIPQVPQINHQGIPNPIIMPMPPPAPPGGPPVAMPQPQSQNAENAPITPMISPYPALNSLMTPYPPFPTTPQYPPSGTMMAQYPPSLWTSIPGNVQPTPPPPMPQAPVSFEGQSASAQDVPNALSAMNGQVVDPLPLYNQTRPPEQYRRENRGSGDGTDVRPWRREWKKRTERK
jgi:hypothetical protein